MSRLVTIKTISMTAIFTNNHLKVSDEVLGVSSLDAAWDMVYTICHINNWNWIDVTVKMK